MESELVPVVIGDIGGTNCRLSLIKINTKEESTNIKNLHIKIYKSLEFKNNLEEILKEYLKYLKSENCEPKMAVLGIPGAIINNRVIVSYQFPKKNRSRSFNVFK